MNHTTPILAVKAGIRSLLIPVWALVLGGIFLTMALTSGVASSSGALNGLLGFLFVAVGGYLFGLALLGRLLVSPVGIEMVTPFPTRRIRELAWEDVTSIEVARNRRFVTFCGANGARIPVGPGARHWSELLEVARQHLPEEVTAPLDLFRGKEKT